MRKITFGITLLLAVFNITTSFSQVSPKEGVTPPAYFWEFQQMIQSEYSNGYYADKFRERKQIREQISQGLLPESMLVTDTTFALTLLGQYTNLAGFYTQQQFQAQLYDGPNPTGTVTDYYAEVSYDQLYFTGDAEGWYNMPRTLEEYEGGNSGLGPLGGPRFVWEILQESDPTLNFADYIQYYDGQGKPHIGFVAVVHSGADAASGAFNIWSHRWNFTVFSGTSFTTNDIDPVSGFNVIIDGPYAIMPEREGANNNSGPIAAIGSFAHEFGHIFGLPDLYDTDQSSEGLGNWCLMAGGSYGGNGQSPETPVHMSAWVKKELGWVTPINITSYEDALSVPNVEENPIIYRMWKDAAITNQYYLIENRQRIGFDANIYDSGFLIFHVDDNVGGNQNEDHYKVDLEQADGFRNLNLGQNRGDGGDPFPGSANNTRFDYDTNPNSKDYTLQNTYVSIRNIFKDGNMMVGDFEVGPRSGAYAFGDPITNDFGDVEIGTTSLVNTVILSNYGDQDLVINDIPSSFGDFNLVTALTFPDTLLTFESRMLDFTFSPTVLGNIMEVYPVSSNDPNFSGYTLLGSSYKNFPALDKTFYASSGSQNNGETLIIDKLTGAGTNIGASNFTDIKDVAINEDNGVIYAVRSTSLESYILKVSAGAGDAYLLLTLDLPQMESIAFDTNGDLYGALKNGEIYTIDLSDGSYTLVTTAAIELLAIAFNPLDNSLWATVRNVVSTQKDRVYTINKTTGDTTRVGRTGYNVITNSIAFDETGVLYGIKGSASQDADFFTINTSDGTGTLVGSVALKGLTGIAYGETGVTSVNHDDNNQESVPTEYSLLQNYPNPFNPTTKITFSLPENADVSLNIYNVLGQQVANLINEELSAGTHTATWNSVDSRGVKLSSGIYFYELKAKSSNSDFQQIRKMVLMK